MKKNAVWCQNLINQSLNTTILLGRILSSRRWQSINGWKAKLRVYGRQKRCECPRKLAETFLRPRKGKKNRSKLSAALLPSSSSSEDPANSILSFTNSISADSNSLLKEDHKTPLPNLTNRRQNTKRKRNIKKCDGSKFRKMLKSGFL